MRNQFCDALVTRSAKDDMVFLTGDLGFMALEPLKEAMGERFINAGVAEQNMTGLAVGMAMCGKIIFTYSIANFPTLRCLEQIRNDACYHRADVKVVSVGGGLGYGPLGMSHHATEDLAILRTLPGLTVISPGDPLETACAVEAVARTPGPCYLRLGRAGEPVVHPARPDFEVGRALVLRDGSDLTLIATGGMLAVAAGAAEALAREGVSARVLSMHTIKPLDVGAVLAAARETRAMATIEEHGVIGGLGGAVAEVLAESDLPRVAFRRIGLPAEYSKEVGGCEYLRRVHGLDEPGVLATLRGWLAGRARPGAHRPARADPMAHPGGFAMRRPIRSISDSSPLADAEVVGRVPPPGGESEGMAT
jgi:transketolase